MDNTTASATEPAVTEQKTKKERKSYQKSPLFLAVPLSKLVEQFGPDEKIAISRKFFIEAQIAKIDRGEAYSFAEASPVVDDGQKEGDSDDGGEIQMEIS